MTCFVSNWAPLVPARPLADLLQLEKRVKTNDLYSAGYFPKFPANSSTTQEVCQGLKPPPAHFGKPSVKTETRRQLMENICRDTSVEQTWIQTSESPTSSSGSDCQGGTGQANVGTPSVFCFSSLIRHILQARGSYRWGFSSGPIRLHLKSINLSNVVMKGVGCNPGLQMLMGLTFSRITAAGTWCFISITQ